MMKEIVLDYVNINGNRIEYIFSVSKDLEKYFSDEHTMFIEYSNNIDDVSDGIAVIPFVCNVLPIVWLTDAQLKLKYLDKVFYDNIPNIKQGYIDMYPMLDFMGKINVDELTDEEYDISSRAACFYSGGLDSYATLLKHLDEKPILATIWGSDIKLSDEIGWSNVEKDIINVSEKYGLDYICVKSNFRTVIDAGRLYELVKNSGDGYWHGFQHGIAIIAHLAPVAKAYKIGTVYIASSYPESLKGKYTCASDPTIDNYVCYGNTRTVHDCYEMDRQGKIRFVIKKQKELNKDIFLRVCWITDGGKNCSSCEKCYRTILELIVEGENPNDYGFIWDDDHIKQCEYDLKNTIELAQFTVNQYYPVIQQRMIENKNNIQDIDKYKWLIDMDFNNFNDYPIKKRRRAWQKSIPVRAFRKVKRILHKNN